MSDLELIRRRLSERLAPPHNLQIETARIRQAAVTLLLRESQSAAELLIIKRAERDGDPWSGHLALPGGRAEPEDADLLATAARETHEEIGVDLLSGGEFVGQLPLIAPKNPGLPQIEITPLVALVPPQYEFRFSDEVVTAFWIQVEWLKRDGRSGEYRWKSGSAMQKLPAYPTEQGLIWGITERILTNFLELLD